MSKRATRLCSTRQIGQCATFARKLALEAGATLKRAYYRPRSIAHKGPIDLVTSADLASEKLIVDAINRRFPTHSILAEERSEFTGDSEFRWVIDPLDGTTNFAHGYPAFCVSIAVQCSGVSIVGVVYDPLRDELFSATAGGGARLGRRQIHISKTTKLANALCATGFPYDVHHTRKDNLANFSRIIKRARGIRRGGSAALDLSYVACGRFDLYWEMKLAPWDTAAAALIATEAGARVSDFSGKAFEIEKKEIITGVPAVYNEGLALIK